MPVAGQCPHLPYSIFTSSAYRNRDAKWRFPQEIATLAEVKTQASEVKMLEQRSGSARSEGFSNVNRIQNTQRS
jgi:type II secretory pathway component PulM